MRTDDLPSHAEAQQVRTPFLRINGNLLVSNVRRWQAMSDERGLRLRPHFKTHRSLRLAAIQQAVGAVGITCATLAQARSLVAGGCRDVFLAYPLLANPATSGAIAELATTGTVRFGVSNPDGAKSLAPLLRDTASGVLIEVDVGGRRTGISAQDSGRLGRLVASLGARVDGVYGYPAQGYSPAQRRSAACTEETCLAVAVNALAAVGIRADIVSAGSTPTLEFARCGVITEYRTGTYVFGDRQQLALGSMHRSAVALTVETTVIQRDGSHTVIDAGGKALSRDRVTWLNGFAESLADGALVSRVYDHHGVLPAKSSSSVGLRLGLVANNCNSTASMHREYWVDFGDSHLERWPIDV